VLIYCDSVILIYYLDQAGPWQATAAARLAAARVAGDSLVISDLTRLECRVGPVRTGDAQLLAKFDGFFALPDVQKAALTVAVFDRATQIRATTAVRTADAIHLAAAIEHGCGLFLTNDARLKTLPALPVEQLS